jgi:hypothetical protein
MIISKIPLSDSDFSQKILRKYQKGKWNFLNFPLIVFSKNARHALPLDFKINILMQLNFHNQRVISQVINKNNKWMKNWVSGIDNFFSELIYRPIILKTIRNTRKSINFQHGTISGFTKSMYAISRESAYGFPLSNQIIRHFIKNYNENKILSYHYLEKYNRRYSGLVDWSSHTAMHSKYSYNNSPIFWSKPERYEQHYASDKKNIERYSGLVKLKNLPYQQNLAVSGEELNNQNLIFGNPKTYYTSQMKDFVGNNLLKNNMSKYILKYNLTLLINDELNHIGKNSFNEINQNSITFIQPIIKKDERKNSSSSSSFISFKRRGLDDNDNFTFQDHGQIDRKIEQIKKISEEAKEIVSRKFLESPSGRTEIQPEIDMNRLSNKVYKMIEYNLKIEKERRGYL